MLNYKIFNSKKQCIEFIRKQNIPLNNFVVRYLKNYCKSCKNKKIVLKWYN